MAAGPPTSVLLPTVEWTSACAEVRDQLGPDDELLILCDAADDPVADRDGDLPDNAEVVVAGEPEGCSGKANAIAVGMERASHDRIAWTDDDFHHPPDWLDRLHADYERHGPVSELPVFVGRDPLATAMEPMYAIGGTLAVYLGDQAWGGAVLFERSDLDVERFLDELRRSVSDDGLLSEHLDLTALKRTRRVAIGGTLRETVERHVRFTKIIWRHDRRNTAITSAVGTLVAALCLLFPIPMLGLSAVVAAAVYAYFGIDRWTAVLAYVGLIAQVSLSTYAFTRETFVWGGRRYRWPSKFEVEIEEE